MDRGHAIGNFRLPQHLYDELKQAQLDLGRTSVVDLLREALELFFCIMDATRRGQSVTVGGAEIILPCMESLRRKVRDNVKP